MGSGPQQHVLWAILVRASLLCGMQCRSCWLGTCASVLPDLCFTEGSARTLGLGREKNSQVQKKEGSLSLPSQVPGVGRHTEMGCWIQARGTQSWKPHYRKAFDWAGGCQVFVPFCRSYICSIVLLNYCSLEMWSTGWTYDWTPWEAITASLRAVTLYPSQFGTRNISQQSCWHLHTSSCWQWGSGCLWELAQNNHASQAPWKHSQGLPELPFCSKGLFPGGRLGLVRLCWVRWGKRELLAATGTEWDRGIGFPEHVQTQIRTQSSFACLPPGRISRVYKQCHFYSRVVSQEGK